MSEEEEEGKTKKDLQEKIDRENGRKRTQREEVEKRWQKKSRTGVEAGSESLAT